MVMLWRTLVHIYNQDALGSREGSVHSTVHNTTWTNLSIWLCSVSARQQRWDEKQILTSDWLKWATQPAGCCKLLPFLVSSWIKPAVFNRFDYLHFFIPRATEFDWNLKDDDLKSSTVSSSGNENGQTGKCTWLKSTELNQTLVWRQAEWPPSY